MAQPTVAGLQKSYSIEWERLVSWWFRRGTHPYIAKAFDSFAYFKNSRHFAQRQRF